MATTLRHGCISAVNITSVRSSEAKNAERSRISFLGDNSRLRQGSSAKLASIFEPCRQRSVTFGSLRINCMVLETKPSVEKKTTLHDLFEKEGQSPWYDNLSRPVVALKSLIDNGVRGVTSNPTIFEKAITSSDLYDDQFRQLMKEGNGVEEVFWGLAVTDIQDACDLFLALYEESKGGDGFVSLEVSPRLAQDGEGTVAAANRLHKLVNRPNLYIKIPATAECVPAVKSVISQEISVNVTLIFSLARYEAVIDAYLEGLEAIKNDDLSKVSSVASFFVSRVDVLVDKRLEKIGSEEALALRGKVNTMPLNALEAFVDHGTVSRTIDANLGEAKQIYDKVEELGILWADVGSQLEVEGVASFEKSFDNLISSLQAKADKL